MRGRPGCPTGQEKKPVRATVSNPPFLQGKVGYQIAPSSDPASPAHLPPKGKALGVGVSLQGIQSPSVQRTRPAGHASQSSAGRSRRKRIKSCFDRLCRPKHTSHPESAGFAGAVRGASPNFGRGLPPSRQLDTPVLCPPERRQSPGAPPKIPHSTLFSASTISKSRSFLRAVRFTAKEKTTVSTAAHR